MKVDILASGSSGNCIALTSGETTILIDAGIAKTKIEKRLNEVGIRADQIAAIFVTHAHGDHIKGLPLANKYRIPVYASDGEWKGISGVDDDLQRVVSTTHGEYEMIPLEGVHIYPFKTHHDAYEPVGYAIEDDTGNRCCVVMDTGHVDSDMLDMMEGNIYIIESNHDPDMVVESNYPISVQARILSDIGHLSNDQTASALARLIKGRGERIYLTHLSSSNNMPKLAEMIVNTALRKQGFEVGKHYFLEVF
ncbi:MBL fold metallo-hydrolase [Paenibacillus crassostreae]|uniref:MBL fold metallo-hydrolase n=1 Tax=Paenibacillus crassostreae TaxID=1763538 RepID=A0A167C663_9BACL|nr:MBL fold metallo-hydrolase [Paenibacillus crassostreae]AOZ91597.1 MBL fold metallo-hydrolase [Paenibacillus crassostreae]OAB72828.1 MBL fold metallo-hydrolase [Paenibacillus crassostreae]